MKLRPDHIDQDNKLGTLSFEMYFFKLYTTFTILKVCILNSTLKI